MELILHPRTRAALQTLHAGPAGSYLFHGPRSVGKATAALDMAHTLACHHPDAASAAACPIGRQIQSGNYPDLHVLRPEAKPSITIEQVRRLLEKLALRPYYPDRTRLALVDDASQLTLEAANALLKAVEEPPAGTVFVFVAEQPEGLLGTIRSRCTPIYFVAPATNEVARYLAQHYQLPADTAVALAVAGATPGAAISLAANPEALAAHRQLAQDATDTLTQSKFHRLLLAGRLATAGTDLVAFTRLLHDATRRRLLTEATSSPAAHQLQALEQFRRHLAAGLAPRPALEHLMLELGE